MKHRQGRQTETFFQGRNGKKRGFTLKGIQFEGDLQVFLHKRFDG